MGAQLEQGHWPAAAAHGDPLAIESKDFKSLAVTKRQNIYIYFHCREIKVVFTYFFSSFKTHCVVGSWTELITSMRRWGTRLPKDSDRSTRWLEVKADSEGLFAYMRAQILIEIPGRLAPVNCTQEFAIGRLQQAVIVEVFGSGSYLPVRLLLGHPFIAFGLGGAL